MAKLIRRTKPEEILTKIDEAYLIYSNNFKNYLRNMISIEKMNYELISEDISSLLYSEKTNSVISFVDITDSEDMISYTPISRIFKDYKKTKQPITKKRFNEYIQAESDLHPYLKYIKNYNGIWSKNRSEMKIGKFVRKTIEHLIDDKEIEEIVNKYKSLYKTRKKPELKLISGEEISKWYNQDNYLHTPTNDKDGLGSLGKSCMRYDTKNGFFDIYSKNTDVCQMLILQSTENKDKIIGRALVWKLNDGRFYMDRIYTHFDSDVYLFRNYASEKGWEAHYINNKLPTKEMQKFEVNLVNVDFMRYPYLDTFCVLDKDSKKLQSSFEMVEKDEILYTKVASGKPETYIRNNYGRWTKVRKQLN